jgi:hypothetical protein
MSFLIRNKGVCCISKKAPDGMAAKNAHFGLSAPSAWIQADCRLRLLQHKSKALASCQSTYYSLRRENSLVNILERARRRQGDWHAANSGQALARQLL